MLRSPRRLAITSSSFCCAVNFRYLRVSPNVVSSSLSGRSSDASRTEPRRLRRLASPSRRSIRSRQHEAGEQGKRIDETDWRTETNLGEQLGLDQADTHQA